jgi:thioredoxin-related protein
MKKVKCFFLISFLAVLSFSFGNKPKEKINWISFEELQEQYQKNPKPILVDLYTNWCGWCKEMDRTTYKNAQVISYINKHYYAVKFNAETSKEVVFNNKTYHYNEQYKTNDLAMYLSFGQLEYPNTIFLTSMDASPAPLAGYLKPKEIEAPLKYFAENKNDGETFVEFNRKLKNEW